MSRIHEALKKAEEERVRGAHPEPVSNVGETPCSGTSPVTECPPGGEHRVVPAQLSPEPVQGELTLQTLLASCPQPQWNLDSKMLLSFNGQDPVHGPEEFRSLRSRLYQIRENRPLQTVLVTSALPREGKTFIAANLARAIVRQPERRALLIDGDLRGSHLHHLLGAPATPGLSDYLLGEADELSVIQWNPKDHLFFIAGGKKVANPNELIGNGRLKVLTQRLAPLFTWIIFDSSPAIPVSDASLLAAACDGVLFVVQANSTPFDLAQKGQQQLKQKRVLGVVLNRVEPHASYSSCYAEYCAKQGKRKDA